MIFKTISARFLFVANDARRMQEIAMLRSHFVVTWFIIFLLSFVLKVTCPGTFLRDYGYVYLKVNCMGLEVNTKSVAPTFPLFFHERLRFERVSYVWKLIFLPESSPLVFIINEGFLSLFFRFLRAVKILLMSPFI